MRRLLLVIAVLALGLTALPAAAASGAPAYHPTTVLVGLETGANRDLVHDLAAVGAVANTLDAIGVDVVAVPEGTVEAAVAAYAAVQGVAFAEPNWSQALSNTPNDALFSEQYALQNIEAEAGWALYDPDASFDATGGAVIGVVDSGIDLAHPEFAGKIRDCRSFLTGTGIGVPGVCQENNVHGTHVSGIAAATANNVQGIAGVAFDAEILALQACTLVCFTADTAAAMVYAADNGADVTNYSFGGPSANDTSRVAVEYAASKGVLQVAAAGNEGEPDSVGFPAAYPEVVAVSSTDSNDELSSFSSQGPEVDVAAPGSSILSTFPAGQYGTISGTSMSSPHVAGLGALLRSLGLDADQARQAIIDGADLVGGASGKTDEFGHGRINVANSVQIAIDTLGGGDADEAERERGRSGTAPGRNR